MTMDAARVIRHRVPADIPFVGSGIDQFACGDGETPSWLMLSMNAPDAQRCMRISGLTETRRTPTVDPLSH